MGKTESWDVNLNGQSSTNKGEQQSKSDSTTDVSVNHKSRISEAFVVMSLSPTISYKAAEPTFYPWTIRHDSLTKAIWDWIVLLLVIYTAIEVPYNVAFILPMYKKVRLKNNALEIINLNVDIMFIIDVAINFRTTYVQGRSAKVVCDPKKIARHYLKTWFFVDFLSAIPFELFSLVSSKEVSRQVFSMLQSLFFCLYNLDLQ